MTMHKPDFWSTLDALEEKDEILRFHNDSQHMKGLLIRRSSGHA
jgi:hypothetical protein